MRFRWKWGIGIAALALAAFGGVMGWRARAARAEGTLATAEARKGEFLVLIRCRGELKARRSVQVSAPVNVPELRIVWLAPSGSPVREADPVVRFDPSSARQQLAEKEAALKQAQAALDQATAEAGIVAEQDRRSLAEARYQVERARLEVSLTEIVSALKAAESKIDLSVAERRLSAQAANAKLGEVSSAARIASLKRQRDKARDEVELTKERLSKMELKAPLSGIMIYLPNYSQGWMNAKPFKVGDQVWPGAPLGEIPDLATLEMEGRIEEIDRGRIAVGQQVRVRVDSLPEKNFPARLGQLSPMTLMGFEWPPTRTFRGLAALEQPDARLRPGMNGSMDVVVSRIPNAVSIPAKALFTLRGKPVVYLARPGRYETREVKVLARNPDEVAVEGIPEKSKVTLVEPETRERSRI
ncbi:MAG: efflux RND transporter periplasmic adaptor subunit [Acidobacteria bacterium]|nr:efflux RND transporter periplasmic adaptor subunit [Acidobacteriota bacterium]